MNSRLSFLLSLCLALTSAHELTIKRVKPPQVLQARASDLQITVDENLAETSFDLNSVHDLIYIANITVGSNVYPVQLDTGSSDLFVHGDTSPLPGSQGTDLSYNLTYAVGWASGRIAYAPVEFLGNNISSQVFLDATTVKNPALTYGAAGIAGLGFNKLSFLDLAVNNTNKTTGRSLLFNLFAANMSTLNFIAFALQRETQPGDDVQGSFSIGEYDPKYLHISGSNRIPTWPVHNPYRWNVLVDAVVVNESIVVPSTRVAGAPGNKAVTLMDSGSSYSYAPKGICDAIYGNVPGATFDSALGYWKVPCGIEINMAFQIAGEIYPIHPLDVNPNSALDPTTCIGSFVPQQFSIGNDFDWIVGDNFLRSVYSVYDFGDFDGNGLMGDPYMKLLSIVDADEASIEFHKIRGGIPKSNITFTGLNGASIAPSYSISNDISQSLELIGRFIPAMLGIVALNAVVVIVCCLVWLVSFCRRRSQKSCVARTPHRRAGPIPMNPRNSFIAADPSAINPHAYQPVSMALTEDTFVPPSPAFHRFEKKKTDGDGRPSSALIYDPSAASPLSPAFSSSENQRLSMADYTRASVVDNASMRGVHVSSATSIHAVPIPSGVPGSDHFMSTNSEDCYGHEPVSSIPENSPRALISSSRYIREPANLPTEGTLLSSPPGIPNHQIPAAADARPHHIHDGNFGPTAPPPGPAILHVPDSLLPPPIDNHFSPRRASQVYESSRIDVDDRPKSII